MMRKTRLSLLLLLLILAGLWPGHAHAGFSVGNGAVVHLADGVLNLGCGDVVIETGGTLNLDAGSITACRDVTIETGGTMNGSTGTLTMNGTWTNNGTFHIDNSTVTFTAGCGAVNDVQGASDSDGDGLSDGEEGLGDANNDGVQDFLDTDTDDDGHSNTQDAFPNDPTEWVDTDGDGIGNNADPDDDNDGMPDDWEAANGLDPLVDDAGGDADGDGYTNLQEYLFDTDPRDAGSIPPVPKADAGPDQDVPQGALVCLDGFHSSDPDGAIDVFFWEQTAGSGVSLSGDTGIEATFTAPVGVTEALTFRLTVTDQSGLIDTDTCIVNVTSGVSEPPTADAGADQKVMEGAVGVALDGSGSSDPDGTVAAYRWEQADGSAVTLSDETAAAPTFTAPANGTEVLAFRLTVTDDDGLKGTDTCIVNVTDAANTPPTADAGADQTVNEGGTVTLNGAGSTDPEDGSPGDYLWTQVRGVPVTLSNPAAARPTFVTPPVGAGGTDLTFQLEVTDSGRLKARDRTVVTIRDNGITGFPDDVLPFMTATNEEIGIQALSGGRLVSLEVVDPDTIPDTPDKPDNLYYGLLDLQIRVHPVGGASGVTVHLPTPAPWGYDWYKYSSADGWSSCREYAAWNDPRDQVALALTDGGAGDHDHAANGIIVDPSGLGSPVDGGDDRHSSNWGGSTGCFIFTLTGETER